MTSGATAQRPGGPGNRGQTTFFIPFSFPFAGKRGLSPIRHYRKQWQNLIKLK